MDTDHVARRAKRLKIFEPFQLVDQGRECRAHLLDISESGARIHCEGQHAIGATVTLKVRGRSISGTVAWVRAPRMGVNFLDRITPETIDRLLGR